MELQRFPREDNGLDPLERNELAAGRSRHDVVGVVLLFRGSGVEEIGFAPAFDSLRGTQQWRGLDASHGAAGRECHGDGGRRDILRKFGDHQEVIVPGSEKTGMNSPAKIFNRNADGIEAILGVANNAVPSICGVADLMAEIRHLTLLSQ
jgi:hypothetical protein